MYSAVFTLAGTRGIVDLLLLRHWHESAIIATSLIFLDVTAAGDLDVFVDVHYGGMCHSDLHKVRPIHG